MIDDILTPREREVIRLVSKGYSDKQVMDALCISIGTTHSFMNNIYQKLNVYDGTAQSKQAKRVRIAILYLREHKELLDELD